MAVSHEQSVDRSGRRLSGAAVGLLWLSRAFGAAPVAIEHQRSCYVVRVRRKYALIACGIGLLLGLMALVALTEAFNIQLMTSPVEDYMIVKLSIMSGIAIQANLVLFVAFLGGPGRMRRFMSYYTQLHEIRASIESQSTCKSLEKVLTITLTSSVIFVFVLCIINVVVSTHEVMFFQWNFYVHIAFKLLYIAYVVSTLLALQITFVVISVVWALQSLNKSIERLEAQVQFDGSHKHDSSAIIDKIDSFAGIYVTILDICRQINAAEGFTMLLLLFDYTSRILWSAFYTTATHVAQTEDLIGWKVAHYLVQMLHCLRAGFHLVMLVEPCHRTQEELKRTEKVISKLLCAPTTALDGVSIALIRFYHATEHRGHVFIPLGTFKFSRSLYTALIGGLTTIIILCHNSLTKYG